MTSKMLKEWVDRKIGRSIENKIITVHFDISVDSDTVIGSE